MRGWGLIGGCLLLSGVVLAQDVGLEVRNVRVETSVDVYGVAQEVLRGEVVNRDPSNAYTDIVMTADVLNAQDVVIGEAFGYVVNACGVAVFDDPIQPGESQSFALSLDLYPEFSGAAATPDHFDVRADATATAAEPSVTLPDGIMQISAQEVVRVDWRASDILLYGVGCDAQIFTRYDWYRHDVPNDRTLKLAEHPDATFITDALITATGVTGFELLTSEKDPSLLERSYLSLMTDTTRIIWQNFKNDLYTAERDGSAAREVHTYLHQYSLRGLLFTPDRNFLAYYFGAYGEPVRYITSRPDGRLISNVITVNPPSLTVPGLQYDGARAIISGTFDGVSGYFFQSLTTPTRELLFEVPLADLAGNNYPAPAYFRQDDDTRLIYVIRPLDGVAVLQCLHYEGKTLTTLATLPLQLATDERAWAWLSPDGTKLAITANGRHPGLWLADLTQLPACVAPATDPSA